MNTRSLLAVVHQYQGRYQEARQLHEHVLHEAEQLGATRTFISTLGNLAALACAEQDYSQAQILWMKCLERDRALEYRWGMASSLGCLGYVAYHLDDMDGARRFYQEGLALALEVADRSLILSVVEGMAGVVLNEGDAASAARLMGSVDAMREAMGSSRPLNLQQEFEADTARVRQMLGNGLYEALWAEGAAMERENLLHALFAEMQV